MTRKSCPFCGGEPVLCFNAYLTDRPRYWVLCRECHACPGEKHHEEEAWALWNRRTQDQAA